MAADQDRTDRRRFFQTALAGTAGAGALLSIEEKVLLAQTVDGGSPPPPPAKPTYDGPALETGKLGSLTISRVVMGGNLIGGFAHSRDLTYVSRLLREYNTDEKIYDTLALAEACGINTIQLNTGMYSKVEAYRKERGGKIQAILCVDAEFEDPSKVHDQVQEMVARGVSAMYTHGMQTDGCVMDGHLDRVAKVVEIVHSAGIPSGIGAHSLETPIAAEKAGIPADFYVKTYHPDTYWSASPPEARDEWCWYRPYSQDHDGYHDNIFCVNPKRTEEVFQAIEKPWFAFKVMAAGALNPQTGFTAAYQAGADFIIAGMFDFQVKDDVEIAVKALKRSKERPRVWRA
jgi:hypothetical protein